MKTRRYIFYFILCCIAFLGLLSLTPMAGGWLSILLGMTAIRGTESKLQEPKVYEPVARRLAIYCQSDQSLFPKYLSYAWLPDELAKVYHAKAIISTNQALVMMGGGFYHFGYLLTLNAATSVPGTNIWELYLSREGNKPNKLLFTLPLASTQQVSSAELEQITSTGYDFALKQGREEAYESKVMMKLRFRKTSDAANICKEWIQHKPNTWLPRFTQAHIHCRLGKIEPASADFAGWVQNHQNFAHCIYLALFQFREGRTNQALAGVRLALNQPLVEPPGTDGNKFYLGQNGALIAYIYGDYDLARAMCDKMLADFRSETSWKREALRLKAALIFLNGNQEAALKELTKAEASRDESMIFSLQNSIEVDKKMRTAIEQKNVSYLKNPAQWSDAMVKWFSPFETDETGIHGSGLHNPTPYPSTWISDEMDHKTNQSADSQN